MTRAVRSELIKIRTTNTWWLMAIGLVLFAAIAMGFNMLEAHFADLGHQPTPDGDSPQEVQARQAEEVRYAAAHTAAGIAKVAANLYTSGQFFGVMLLLVLGALVMTNEFFHQTATATFLTTPHRTTVIVAKFITATVLGFLAWLLVTAVSIPAGAIFLGTQHVSASLTHPDVVRSVLLNLAAFVMWSVLGVAIGVLIRSQIATVVTGVVVYLVGFALTSVVFSLIHAYLIKSDWVLTAEVVMPAIASYVMVTPGEAYPNAPAQWVGAAVLIGYVLVAGGIGTLVTRKRDIS